MAIWLKGSLAEPLQPARDGLVSGIFMDATTMRDLAGQAGLPVAEVLSRLADMYDLPQHVQLFGPDYRALMKEAERLARLLDAFQPLLPLTAAGLAACARLNEQGFQVAITGIAHPGQVLLAVEAGAATLIPEPVFYAAATPGAVSERQYLRDYLDRQGRPAELMCKALFAADLPPRLSLGFDGLILSPTTWKLLAQDPATDVFIRQLDQSYQAIGGGDWLNT
ncbi:MAG: hypothetical protein OHK0039_40230 [Bacteroidia bacterium]